MPKKIKKKLNTKNNMEIVAENNVEFRERIKLLIEKATFGLYERDEQVAVAILAALSGQNIFLLGTPGTAKSMIARRIRSIFESNRYFECLMHKHLEPTDIFGPISLPKLKDEGLYHRITEGYLPDADVAFLDEIWKSGPTILNTLLTITNEKYFRNGKDIVEVPLKFLVSASNETPTEDGLEALYDRFAVRLYVPAMEKQENFEKLLYNNTPESFIDCKDMAITNEEFSKWHKQIDEIELSSDTMAVISKIRSEIAERSKKEGLDSVLDSESDDEDDEDKPEPVDIYVSDRRWVKATLLVKAVAFFSGRAKTNIADALLLKHCLWTTNENREIIYKIVEDSVREIGFSFDGDYTALVEELKKMEHKITKENTYKKNQPEIVNIKGIDCYIVPNGKGKGFMYADAKKLKLGEVVAIDENGKALKTAKCVPGQGLAINDKAVTAKVKKMRQPGSARTTTVKFAHYAGDPIMLNKKQAKEYQDKLKGIKKSFDGILNTAEERKITLEDEVNTPFLPKDKQEIPFEGVNKQIDTIKKEMKKCDLLNDKILKLTDSK